MTALVWGGRYAGTSSWKNTTSIKKSAAMLLHVNRFLSAELNTEIAVLGLCFHVSDCRNWLDKAGYTIRMTSNVGYNPSERMST